MNYHYVHSLGSEYPWKLALSDHEMPHSLEQFQF
jgi:hypothetical protein